MNKCLSIIDARKNNTNSIELFRSLLIDCVTYEEKAKKEIGGKKLSESNYLKIVIHFNTRYRNIVEDFTSDFKVITRLFDCKYEVKGIVRPFV